jgi:hypothetical protein
MFKLESVDELANTWGAAEWYALFLAVKNVDALSTRGLCNSGLGTGVLDAHVRRNTSRQLSVPTQAVQIPPHALLSFQLIQGNHLVILSYSTAYRMLT